MATNRYTVFGIEILAENRNGTKRDIVPDPLGSTRVLLDDNQVETDSYTYWPYGEEQSHSGNSNTPFTFVGSYGYYSNGAGGTYIRSRWYSPNSGSWNSTNGFWPIWPSYQYAHDIPVLLTDPTGLSNAADLPPLPGWIPAIGAGGKGIGVGSIWAAEIGVADKNGQLRWFQETGEVTKKGKPVTKRVTHLDYRSGRTDPHFNANTGPLTKFDHNPVPAGVMKTGTKGFLHGVGKVAVPVGIAMDIYDIWTAPPGQKGRPIGGAIGGWAGAAGGAAIGTLILPGIGTVVGAFVGGVLGYYGGSAIGGLFDQQDGTVSGGGGSGGGGIIWTPCGPITVGPKPMPLMTPI